MNETEAITADDVNNESDGPKSIMDHHHRRRRRRQDDVVVHPLIVDEQQQYYAEAMLNMTLFDPPRYGWTALGGITDVLSPHERSLRRSTCLSYRRKDRRSTGGQQQKQQQRLSSKQRGIKQHNLDRPVMMSKQPQEPQEQQQQKQEPSSSGGEAGSDLIVLKDTKTLLTPEGTSIRTDVQSTTIASENQKQIVEEVLPTQQQSQPQEQQEQSNQPVVILTTTTKEGDGSDQNDHQLVLVRQEQPEQHQKDPLTHSSLEIQDEQPQRPSPKEVTAADADVVVVGVSSNEHQQQQQQQQQSVTRPIEEPSTILHPPPPPPPPPLPAALPMSNPADIDMGVKLTGLSSDILGMTIRRRVPTGSSSSTNNNDTIITDTNSNNMNHQQQQQSTITATTNGEMGNTNNNNDNNTNNNKTTNAATTSTTATHSTTNNKRRTGGGGGGGIGPYECAVHAFKDGVLDMYTYHRGREGMEPRDPDCGELLCRPVLTDTNHSLDMPKLSFAVTVQFPLFDTDDGSDDGDNHDNNNNDNAHEDDDGRPMFHDVLEWDLSDPATPSPLTYATSLAKEFGLDFGQTMKVATSIEQQIDAHVWRNVRYSEPVAIRQGSIGQERGSPRQPGPILQAYRYDQVIDTGRGGVVKPKKERIVMIPTVESKVTNQSTTSAGCTTAMQQQLHRRRQRRTSSMDDDYDTDESTAASVKVVAVKSLKKTKAVAKVSKNKGIDKNDDDDGDGDDGETEEKYLSEVKKQARAASVIELKQRCTSNGGTIAGQMECLRNVHCHICHKRTDVGYSFACGNSSHIYCASHVNTRLGIPCYSSSNVACDYCPVCSLNCTCAKCLRKLSNVATIFKALCMSQSKEPTALVFPSVLEKCCMQLTLLSKEVATAEVTISSYRRKMKKDAIAKKQQAAATPANQKEESATTPSNNTANSNGQVSKVRKSISLHKGGPKQGMVPKPPLLDFPREIFKGEEFDVGTVDDYFTVFSGTGQRSVMEIPDAWLEEERETVVESTRAPTLMSSSVIDGAVVEDGNVDYCYVCQTPGNLFCCDFCPRAFHLECIHKAGHSVPSEGRWECFICTKEKAVTEDDFVDGKDSIDLICASFLDMDGSDQRAFIGLDVLSRIHGMLVKLMMYDFGTVFSSPVDASVVAGYKQIVKHPMDLGTICFKLINKGYAWVDEEDVNMDDIVSSVLEDVELVWHNCFLFNGEGTSIYRMGEVQRRRAQMIQRRSFEHLLSEKVKNRVRTFIQGAEKSRTAALKRSMATGLPRLDDPREKAMRDMKLRGKRKIALDSPKLPSGRSIAVLDTVSGRVVRVYSTSNTAAQAVRTLRKCRYRCEWKCDTITNVTMKLIAEICRKDPKVLLFGYRWVFLEELRAGRVAFSPATDDLIEMRQNHCTFVFQSVEDALSTSDLPASVELGTLRKKLKELPSSGEWTEFYGLYWRRPIRDGYAMAAGTKNDQYDGSPKDQRQSIQIPSSLTPNDSQQMDSNVFNEKSWRNCVVVKLDLVTNRVLVGFEYLPVALKDWMQTTAASPTFPETEARTIENFKRYYLDGDRNVDGIVWRTMKSPEGPFQKSAAMSDEGNNNVADPIDGVSTSFDPVMEPAQAAHRDDQMNNDVSVELMEQSTTSMTASTGFSGMAAISIENPGKRKLYNEGNSDNPIASKGPRLSTAGGSDQNDEPKYADK